MPNTPSRTVISRRRAFHGVLLGALGVAVGATGCGSRQHRVSRLAFGGTPAVRTSATPNSANLPEASAKPGGTLAVGAAGIPAGADPVAVNAALTDAFVSLVYNGLLAFRDGTTRYPDPSDPTVVPDLAIAAPEQPDEQTYVFQLRQDVRWQLVAPLNGRPFVADDVAQHYRRAAGDARSALRPQFGVVDAVTAPDQATVQFKLKAPYAPFLSTIAGGFARFILPPELDGPARAAHPAGTGPFVLGQADPNRQASFTRNPDYFKRAPGGTALPYLDRVTWLVLPEPAARLQAYQAQQAQVTWSLSPDEATQLHSTNPNDYDFAEAAGVSNQLLMALDRPPFDDVRVRQAVALAIDRADVIARIAAGHGRPDLPVPVFLQAYALTAAGLGTAARFLGHDLQAAKQLLTAAGHSDGLQTTLSLTAQYGTTFVQAARAVQGYLREAGIAADERQLDYPTFVRSVASGSSDGLVYLPRVIAPDPDAYLGELYVPGGLYYRSMPEDPQLTDLVTRQRQTLDAGQRSDLIAQLQRYLCAQQYRVLDVAIAQTFAWQRSVQNYRGSIWPSFSNLETAWLLKS